MKLEPIGEAKYVPFKEGVEFGMRESEFPHRIHKVIVSTKVLDRFAHVDQNANQGLVWVQWVNENSPDLECIAQAKYDAGLKGRPFIISLEDFDEAGHPK